MPLFYFEYEGVETIFHLFYWGFDPAIQDNGEGQVHSTLQSTGILWPNKETCLASRKSSGLEENNDSATPMPTIEVECGIARELTCETTCCVIAVYSYAITTRRRIIPTVIMSSQLSWRMVSDFPLV